MTSMIELRLECDDTRFAVVAYRDGREIDRETARTEAGARVIARHMAKFYGVPSSS